MTIYNHGCHVSGTWNNEGHTVTFTALEDDSIIISELVQIPFSGINSFSRTVSLEAGIKFQDRLIKWQYKKIS